jgi:hypothetical protein
MTGLRASVRRRLVRFLRPSSVVVCEYNAWGGYLINAACPDAIRVRLSPGERADGLLAAVPSAAHVLFMHIDLSDTTGFLTHESEFLAGLKSRWITVVNAGATDIRKRTLHERLESHGLPSPRAEREGSPDELLMIKTDLNCGGVPERRLRLNGRLSPAVAEPTLPLTYDKSGYPQYPVCRRDEIPAATWSDPTLVIERFIENPEHVFFRTYVLGRATVVAEAWVDARVKKLSGPVRKKVDHFFWYDKGTHIPLGLTNARATHAAAMARQFGNALGVDFHTSDIVMDSNGTMVPVDINKTPWWGPQVRPGVVEHFRRGLEGLINEA